jgi:hypothetical protein
VADGKTSADESVQRLGMSTKPEPIKVIRPDTCIPSATPVKKSRTPLTSVSIAPKPVFKSDRLKRKSAAPDDMLLILLEMLDSPTLFENDSLTDFIASTRKLIHSAAPLLFATA